ASTPLSAARSSSSLTLPDALPICLAYLGSVARDTPTAANVRAYAEIVRERSLLRQLIRAGTDIAAEVYNNKGESARDLVDRAERAEEHPSELQSRVELVCRLLLVE